MALVMPKLRQYVNPDCSDASLFHLMMKKELSGGPAVSGMRSAVGAEDRGRQVQQTPARSAPGLAGPPYAPGPAAGPSQAGPATPGPVPLGPVRPGHVQRGPVCGPLWREPPPAGPAVVVGPAQHGPAQHGPAAAGGAG